MVLISVTIAAALFVAAGLILVRTHEQRRMGGLPLGDLVYGDNLAWDCPVLVSHRYGLRGKPDALVRLDSGALIPVERKKTLAPRRGPYDGDLIQAALYCILVEEESGRSPPFMRIQYADRHFDEPYTPEVKRWVLESCAGLRQARNQSDCHRSHRIAAKCRNCGQRQNCREAL
jgi:CRISPR-associated exonuclease Cas4